jgi:hypothetical protein
MIDEPTLTEAFVGRGLSRKTITLYVGALRKAAVAIDPDTVRAQELFDNLDAVARMIADDVVLERPVDQWLIDWYQEFKREVGRRIAPVQA